MRAYFRDRRGSSTVFLSMVFVTFAICIALAIGISRKLVVKSECEVFGHVWTKAILSEYDRHLLSDYGIMAYFGNEAEVKRRIDLYMGYSAGSKLDIQLGSSGSDLAGYELGEPENFRRAIRLSLAGGAAHTVMHGGGRHIREGAGEDPGDTDSVGDETGGGSDRVIGNPVVIDTLPSGGIGSSISTDSLVERAKDSDSPDGLSGMFINSGTEAAFIYMYFGNHVTAPDTPKSWFTNEWEYIIAGKLSDEENLSYCRKRLFLMRNALNLISLYRDSAKVELVTSVAELITPGPLSVVTQAVIAEAWAALETEQDLKDLYSGGRAAMLKTPEQWKTGLEGVIGSDEVRRKLDEESRKMLDENMSDAEDIARRSVTGSAIHDGLSYDDHLMLMMLMLNERVRLLRIMDLVQINMKYRYYRDFNLMEYYVGTRFSITANGRDYVFEDSYR